MIIGYLSFGRVPGCLGLGALFLWDEWREGRTDRLPAGCGIGAALDALWGELTSALWWMLWDVVLVVWGWRFLSKGFC